MKTENKPDDEPQPNRTSDELVAELYKTLKGLAAKEISGEAPGVSLQPTDLVHEAFIVLGNNSNVGWETDGHFFRAAARAMRRILIDRARARLAIKRGGGRGRIELDADSVPREDSPESLLDLNDALSHLAMLDADKAQVVELKFFGGLTIPEIADALGKSQSSVKRDWTFARAWLRSNFGES